jgi:hypothetical protein
MLDDTITRKKAKLAGVDDFIGKGEDLKILVQVIERHFNISTKVKNKNGHY